MKRTHNQNIFERRLAFYLFVCLILLPFSFISAQTNTDPNLISTQAALTRNLSQGSTGTDVRTLQSFLAQDTSIYPQGLVTGYYGPLTAAAVRRFQTRYGIAVVGVVGPITRQRINQFMMSGGFGTGGSTGTVSGTSPAINLISSSTLSNQDGTRSITISWQTDRPTRGKIFYSDSQLTFFENSSSTAEPMVNGSVVSDATFGTTKSLSISNLAASTSYNYMIEAIDMNGNVSITWPSSIRTP